VLNRAQIASNTRCGVKLGTMALAVIKAHGVAAVALSANHGDNGRRIEAAGQQNDGSFLSVTTDCSVISAPRLVIP
jgi:hypothetical protein